MSGPTTIAPVRLFAIMAALVAAVAMVLAWLRAGGGPWTAAVLQGAMEAVLFGVVAAPFAAMVHLFGGSSRQAALRAIAAWGVVVCALLLLLAGTGGGLIRRLGSFGEGG